MIAKLKKGFRWQRGLKVTGTVAILTATPVHAALVNLTTLPFNPATVDSLGAAIPAALRQAGDLTGLSVATDGNTIVVGVPQSSGINLTSSGVNVSTPLPAAPIVAPGKAYVYERDLVNGGWIQVATLMASNALNKDNFGVSVAVDGDTIIVGADAKASNINTVKNGAVYVFEKPAGGWLNNAVTNETAQLTPLAPLAASAFFGHSVAIQNGTVVVGKWGNPGGFAVAATSAAYIFERPASGSWVGATPGVIPVYNEVNTLQPLVTLNAIQTPPPYFGFSVAMDGDMIVVNGNLRDETLPAAYVFEKPATAGGWADLPANADPVAELTFSAAAIATDLGRNSPRRLGFDVSVNGNTIAVSAPHYDAPDAAGVGVQDSGAVFVFEKPAGGWPAAVAPALYPAVNEVVMLTADAPATGASFGRSVAITPNNILVSAFSDSTLAADPTVGASFPAKVAPVAGLSTTYLFDKAGAASWAGFVPGLANPAAVTNPAAGPMNEDMFGYGLAAAKTTFVAGAFKFAEDVTVPADGVVDMDAGTAAVQEVLIDLSIANVGAPTVAPPPAPIIGDQVDYTLTVTNNDTTLAASNVMVEDLLPDYLTFVSATPNQGTCDATALPLVRCSLGTIAATGTANVTLSVTSNVLANTNATAGGIPLSNTATVSADQSDNLIANNSATDSAVIINASPVVNLGTTVTSVNEGTLGVQLDASASTDPDGGGAAMTYLWSQVSGEAVTLANANTSIATFDAPALTNLTVNPLVFQVDVTDSAGAVSSLQHTITLLDATAPTITLNNVGPINLKQGDVFTDPGAVVTDNIDAQTNITGIGTVDTATIGTYTLTYDATDAAGNAAVQQTLTVNVADGIAPTITILGPNPQRVVVGTAFVDPGADVTDNVDATYNIPAGVGIVDTTVLGQYMVTYDATDAAGNVATTATLTVNVVDGVAPTLTLIGADPMTVNHGSTFTDPGADLVDNIDAASVVYSPVAVDTNIVGVYTLTYDGVDSAGNPAAQITRTVNVVDATAPTIQLIGNNSMTVALGGTFTDPGADVIDNVDASTIVIGTGSVDTATLGSYTLSYDATDAAGNAATTVTRTVNVIDGVPPVITLNDAGPITLKQGDTFTDPGAVVTDNVDATVNIVATGGSVDTATIGTYTLTYDAVDSTGLSAQTKTLTVIVTDGIAPVIALNGTDPMSVNQGDTFTDPGAVVTDNVDATVNIVATGGSVDTATIGQYALAYSASDAAGNAAAVITRTVNVVDGSAPVITLNGSDPMLINVGDTFADPGATAADAVDGVVTVSSDADTVVDATTAGNYTVTYTATDAAGNAANLARTVVVNAAPVINALPSGNSATVVAGTAYSHDLSVTDPEGDSFSFALQNAPAWLSVTATGLLSGTPATADVGIHSGITLTVTDVNGAAVTVGPFEIEVTAVADTGTTPTSTSGGGGGGGAFDPLSLLVAALMGLGLRRRKQK